MEVPWSGHIDDRCFPGGLTRLAVTGHAPRSTAPRPGRTRPNPYPTSPPRRTRPPTRAHITQGPSQPVDLRSIEFTEIPVADGRHRSTERLIWTSHCSHWSH